MRRLLVYLPLFALLLSLAGCGGLLDQEMRSVVPHLEQSAQAGDQDAGLSSLTELKQALIDLVRRHSETGRLTLSNYTGNINIDVSRAFLSILREDPVCAYTVDYFTHDYLPLSSEVSVNIIYFPDREWDIPHVSNLSGLTDEIVQALKEGRDGLVREIGYYDGGTDLNALLQEAYYRSPEQAVGMPALSFKPYPDSGVSRVIDIRFSYPFAPEETRLRVSQADQALDDLLRDLPDDLEPPLQALRLYDLLIDRVAHRASGEQEGGWTDAEDNLYTALVDGHAVSAGFALAYKLLCDRSGLECRLVTGLRGNTHYVWTLVRLDGDWYHVDAAADAAAGGTHDWFLKTDEQMQAVARWPQAATPRCDATRYTYEALAQLASGENGESAASVMGDAVGPGEEN